MRNKFKYYITLPLLTLFFIVMIVGIVIDNRYKPVFDKIEKVRYSENEKIDELIKGKGYYEVKDDNYFNIYNKIIKEQLGSKINYISCRKEIGNYTNFHRIGFAKYLSLSLVEEGYNCYLTIDDGIYELKFKFDIFTTIHYYFLLFFKSRIFIIIIIGYFLFIYNYLYSYFLDNKNIKFIKLKFIGITSIVIILFTFIEMIVNIGGNYERGAGLVCMFFMLIGLIILIINLFIAFLKGKKILKNRKKNNL